MRLWLSNICNPARASEGRTKKTDKKHVTKCAYFPLIARSRRESEECTRCSLTWRLSARGDWVTISFSQQGRHQHTGKVHALDRQAMWVNDSQQCGPVSRQHIPEPGRRSW